MKMVKIIKKKIFIFHFCYDISQIFLRLIFNHLKKKNIIPN